jgi:hypothetical protein
MNEPIPDTVKHRNILFCGPHPDPDQARSATLLLTEVQGVIHLSPVTPLCLSISYDLSLISLQIIEELLEELGFHLDGSLLIKLKRALYHYTECVERETYGYEYDQASTTRDIFIRRYVNRPHGCRDGRPKHWRRYL